MHQALAQKYKLITGHQAFYRYQPPAILEKRNVKLYWNQTMITDHSIPHNRPDILLVNKDIKKAAIIEIGVPADDNVAETLSEKIRTYEELCEELRQLYRLLEIKVLPIIVSSNGLIPEDTLKSIKLLGLSWELQEIQKAVMLEPPALFEFFSIFKIK